MTIQILDNTVPEPDPGETSPYTLMVVLTAKPERAEELNDRLLDQIELTRAEPGNVTYHLNRGRVDKNIFYFYEAYSGVAAFRDHLDTPYIKQLLADLPPYLATDVEMTFLTMESSPPHH